MLKLFLKNNMHRIMRVLVNQVGLMIFAIIMTFTAGAMSEDLQGSMMLVASLFSIAFYCFLVFYTMREEGRADSVRIEAGRMPYDSAYGLKIGLCATAPNYICVLLMLLGLAVGVELNDKGAILPGFGGDVWAIGYSVVSMVQSMYTGVLKTIFSGFSPYASVVGATIAYTITPLVAPLAAWVGYIVGCRSTKARS